MFLLIAIFCFIVFFIFKRMEDDYQYLFFGLSLVFFLFVCASYLNVKEGDELGEQIEAYKQENEEIISLMNAVVEKCTGEVSSEEDILVLICSTPVLQSNEIVMKNYNTYMENKTKIKELEIEQKKLYRFKVGVYPGEVFKELKEVLE